ncbi:SusC/RagA family TonB-linked outer membrane protein [Mangrovibacterium diazotrophicum]|uniref:TonB-linked SusC/RagA family outer membrane protein n=1 Tax=Mangrovibacterium diazotrophicum TaxID=1261403 RepID=A0A419WBG9_9BACT|nr:TonB-dependent receptor [Mangrovibacterium diazotrophicum]RKD92789.1 TonB-linked SusC/RagA family outer membrane protein [Mangrovibacterium diazotrophicum]
MKKITLLLAILAIWVSAALAQTREITGTVTSSEDGYSLPGVSVSVKGTTIGTITDIDGKYTIYVPESATTLVFSFVGMRTIEQPITGNAINVALRQETVGVDEVIVVAYGTKTKRALTGAVTSVGSDVLENQTAISPLRALQGSAPGVNILTSGGQPGENPTIRIRGIGSVNLSNDPLIVVDGIVFSGNLNSISAEQIETINILKDASASALYGSRASNGVILITTKSGKYGSKEAKISFNAKVGVSNPAVDTYDLVSAEDYMKYSWEALKNRSMYYDGNSEAAASTYATNNLISSLRYNPYSVSNPVGTDGQIVSGAEQLWDTDWYDELTNDNAFYNEYNLNASGGSEDINYFISGSYLNQDGAVIESNFERYSARVNLNVKLKDWLELSTNNSYSKSIQNYPNQEGTSYTSSLQWVYVVPNIYPLYARDADGNLKYDSAGNPIYDYGNASGQSVNAVRPTLGGENAVSSNKINDILYTRTNLLSATSMKFDLYKGLSFKTTLGYERYLFDSYEYDHNQYGSAASVNGRVSQERSITESLTWTNLLNYATTINDHTINVDVISETFDYKYDYLNAQATGFLPNVKVISGSTVPESVGGYINQTRLVSYLARADYSFKQKYFIDFSFRRDASTKFSKDNRWGNFFSVGGSWIVSDEAFLSSVEQISLLKIRSSYGELGNNQGIGYFPYLEGYDTGWSNGDNSGVLQGGVVDPNIKWEKTGLFNVALDYGFLNNRITGTIEYYNKKSIDLLFDKPLAPSLGDPSIFTNIGTVKNTGWEFMVNTVNVHKGDIYWTSSFNISTNKNEILKLPQDEITNGTKKWMVGKSIYDFFIREYAGVNPANGNAMWYMDADDGSKVLTEDYSDATQYYQGSALPDVIGGVSSYFKYKGFDLNILFNYSFGGKIYDSSYAGLMNSLESAGDQLSADIKDRWQQPGDITDVPKLYQANNDYNAVSTRFLFDNDYVRLKALTIGYNLPKSVTSKANLQNVRVYMQADNIWTYQSHKGIDPEQNIAGTTNNRSNQMKTISFGLNIDL